MQNKRDERRSRIRDEEEQVDRDRGSEKKDQRKLRVSTPIIFIIE